MRIGVFLIIVSAISGCSNVIRKKSVIPGDAPVVLTLDARQRVLLSQPDPAARVTPNATSDPGFRRFCAEPSPDVFTVLGVGASGKASIGRDTNSFGAALQAALSSNETGTAITRTQTINMLREMMFRTCERYLSGAISSADFPIVAARDQRIMVSILAIEQLAGAIAPPSVMINASGEGRTGVDAAEMVKVLAIKQENLATAQSKIDELSNAKKKENSYPENCKLLSVEIEDTAPIMKNKKISSMEDCTSADIHESNYRSKAIITVANAVEKIVRETFRQDETQLMCIRALTDPVTKIALGQLQSQCLSYLMTKVATDTQVLADRYGINIDDVRNTENKGRVIQDIRLLNSQRISVCFSDLRVADRAKNKLAVDPVLSVKIEGLIAASQEGADAVRQYLFDMGSSAEYRAYAKLSDICMTEGGM